ncbi:unnamed protein product [Discosporangium mesarthrocarpum]
MMRGRWRTSLLAATFPVLICGFLQPCCLNTATRGSVVPSWQRHLAKCSAGVVDRPSAAMLAMGGSDSDLEVGKRDIDYEADPLTTFLGKFLPREPRTSPSAKDLVFNTGPDAKKKNLPATEMASLLEDGLKQHGWFVTGRVDASLFSEDFYFSDPQVSLTGVEQYAEGVAKLFDQEESRCDVIRVSVSEAKGLGAGESSIIVVEWRLAGRVNLPFQPQIKPYIVTTTFETDSEGLLSTQKDEFSIATWDILLNALFPGNPFGAPPAPPVA